MAEEAMKKGSKTMGGPDNEPKISPAEELKRFEFAKWYQISSMTSVMKLVEGWLVRSSSRETITGGSSAGGNAVSVSVGLAYVPEPHKNEPDFVKRYLEHKGRQK